MDREVGEMRKTIENIDSKLGDISSTPSSYSTPLAAIQAANAVISQAKTSCAEAITQANTARVAISTVDAMQARLTGTRKRPKGRNR